MAGWLSRIFGRSERADRGDGVVERGPASMSRRVGAQSSSRPKGPVEPNRAQNDTTIKIDQAKSSSRLAWPARDEKKALPQPEPSDDREPAFDPHEEPTRLVGARSEPPVEKRTRQIDQPGAAQHQSGDHAILSRRPPLSTPGAPSPGVTEQDEPDDTTRLVSSTNVRQDDDPVVGWLVVIEGPGRGRSVEIGSGANAIGRAPNQKLCLNFGDPRISRERHAVVVYDPVSRRFFLQSGPGRNLTYLGSDVVLEPKEMKPGDTITVGDTVLHFIPYCGADFGWS